MQREYTAQKFNFTTYCQSARVVYIQEEVFNILVDTFGGTICIDGVWVQASSPPRKLQALVGFISFYFNETDKIIIG